MTRTALVTGASGGIGRAAAVALAGETDAVACAYLSDDAGVKETVRAVEDAGAKAESFRSDVSNPDEVEALFSAVADWAEPPVVLVNAAGISRDGLAVRYRPQDFERTLSVNLTGAFLCIRAALPAMLRARWGRVVNVSSAAGVMGNPGQAAYSASKSGLLGLTRTLAKEVGSRGITLNAVCPGLIDTAMTEGLSSASRDGLMAAIPAGRAGTTADVAAAIRFLAGDEASYVNGAVLAVDGGLTA